MSFIYLIFIPGLAVLVSVDSKLYHNYLIIFLQWLHHQCSVKGCSEGYVSIDGNEKVRRPQCAAPRQRIRLAASMPNVFLTCPNSPALGGKNCTPSKYCHGHADMGRYTAIIYIHVTTLFISNAGQNCIYYCGMLTKN